MGQANRLGYFTPTCLYDRVMDLGSILVQLSLIEKIVLELGPNMSPMSNHAVIP